MTQETILAIIRKVAKNHRNKAFDIYEETDIENEVFLIAHKILPDFNTNLIGTKTPEQALENWLNSSISKRLINFHRDKFVGNPNKFKSERGLKLHQRKFNLLYPLNIEEISEDQLFDTLSNNDNFELRDKFFAQLDEISFDLIESYLSGEILSNHYKEVLLKILQDFMNHVGRNATK